MLPVRAAIASSIVWAAALPPAGGTAAHVKELEDRMAWLKREVRDPLRAEYQLRRKALAREPDLNALRLNIARAKKAREFRLAGDPAIVRARQDLAWAKEALPKALEDHVKNSPRVLAMVQQVEEIRAARPQIDSMREELKKQFAEVRQRLAGSPALEEARQAIAAAEKTRQEFPTKHPKVLAARKAREGAQQAIQKRTTELPEYKACEEARRAYEQLKKNSPDLAKARQARDAARKAYEQKLEGAIEASPKGVAVREQIKRSRESEERAGAEQKRLGKQLVALREEVGKAAEIKALREAVEAAGKAYGEAYNNGPQISAARKARGEARQVHAKQKSDETKRAYEEADRLYQGLKRTDPDVVRTGKAREKAQSTYSEKLDQAVRASEKGVAICKQLEEARKAEPQARDERRRLRKELAALRKEIGKSPQLADASKAIEAAEKAYYELPKTHPAFVAARKRTDDTREALAAKVQALPERQVAQRAGQLYDFARRKGPEAQQVHAACEQARRAYEQQLDGFVQTDVRGSALSYQLKQLDSQREADQQQERQLTEELERLRKYLEHNDPVVVEARQAAAKAEKTYEAVVKQRIADDDKAVNEATRALAKRIAQKEKEDFRLQYIRQRLKEVEREIAAIYKQARDLRRRTKRK